jgi:hypothetical protein
MIWEVLAKCLLHVNQQTWQQPVHVQRRLWGQAQVSPWPRCDRPWDGQLSCVYVSWHGFTFCNSALRPQLHWRRNTILIFLFSHPWLTNFLQKSPLWGAQLLSHSRNSSFSKRSEVLLSYLKSSPVTHTGPSFQDKVIRIYKKNLYYSFEINFFITLQLTAIFFQVATSLRSRQTKFCLYFSCSSKVLKTSFFWST